MTQKEGSGTGSAAAASAEIEIDFSPLTERDAALPTVGGAGRLTRFRAYHRKAFAAREEEPNKTDAEWIAGVLDSPHAWKMLAKHQAGELLRSLGRTKISKHEAIAIVNRDGGMQLQTHTTAFANVNASKEVWWFDIPVAKVVSKSYEALDLLVVATDAKVLHHLRIPVAWFRENLSNFHVRDDKQCVSLELCSRSSNLFQDVRPGSRKIQFARFLVNSSPI